MAKSLSDIRSLVRSYLDESSPADWTNAELNTLINQRYHRVYSAAITVFEDYNITKSQFNSVASQQEYGTTDSLPSDIFKIRRVEINFDVSNTNSTPTRALPANIDAVRRNLGNTALGATISTYAFYYYLGGKIGFIPIPDKAGTNAITIWYIKQLADLAADATNIDIPYPDRYFHLIAEGATADALRFGQQDEAAADRFEAKFTAGILLMQEELEDRVAEEGKSVIDVSGEFLDMGALSY